MLRIVILVQKTPTIVVPAIRVMNSAATELDPNMATCSNMVINGISAQFKIEDMFCMRMLKLWNVGVLHKSERF